jgi:glycosyltransferase involved in cell wall biosynthesis
MISFAVHTYNEADALDRLIHSIFKIKNDKINEIFIVDHRSNDHTQDIIEKYKSQSDGRIEINSYNEPRDFGGEDRFTFADLRDFTIRNTKNDYVVLCDSDFIYGPGFSSMIENSVLLLDKGAFATGFEIPVVHDHIEIDNSRVVSHGPIQVHPAVVRILNKNKSVYRQEHCEGLYEGCYPIDGVMNGKIIGLQKHSVISLNIKDKNKKLLRNSMCLFQKEIVNNKNIKENWLDVSEKYNENFEIEEHLKHDINYRKYTYYIKNLKIGN